MILSFKVLNLQPLKTNRTNRSDVSDYLSKHVHLGGKKSFHEENENAYKKWRNHYIITQLNRQDMIRCRDGFPSLHQQQPVLDFQRMQRLGPRSLEPEVYSLMKRHMCTCKTLPGKLTVPECGSFWWFVTHEQELLRQSMSLHLAQLNHTSTL